MLLLAPSAVLGQWTPLTSGSTASLRGLSVVNDRVVWASGSRGTVLKTLDAGATWEIDSIAGAGRMDIRAVNGRSTMVAHAAATAGRIWRTTDGGKTWSLRFQASDTSVFLDALAFFDDRHGIALGDPLGGRFFMLVTTDGGETWSEADAAGRPEASAGEAAFAASGTSFAVVGARDIWLGTGGMVARIARSRDAGRTWTAYATPMLAGASSTGIFSVAFADADRGLIVGGDYQRPDSVRGNAAFTTDGGRTWTPPAVPPRGYRSGVAFRADRRGAVAVAVGTSGSDVSHDGGKTWNALDSTGYNSVQFAPGGSAFAVGDRGRVARLDGARLTPPAKP